MRAILLMATAALLAGCPLHNAKPDLPGAGTLVKPETVIVERRVYVPIPAELTAEEPIAEGPLAECPVVARKRKAGQQRGNAKLRQIRSIQGTEAPR